MRYEFEKVQIYAKKSGKCLCGKKRTRSEVLWMTVNPFNTNKDGSVKTREQVRADLEKEHKDWQAKPIRCSSCPAGAGEEAKP